MSEDERDGVSLVILAKDAHFAKTRLELPRDEARRLARALAARTVGSAVVASTVGAVIVVTGDEAIASYARSVGAGVLAEPRLLGINRAAALGRCHAVDTRPSAAVAVMVADLPDLCPGDIDAVVGEFRETGRPLFVPDFAGSGTTLLIHGPERRPEIGFGSHSAAMHRRLGYREALTAPRGIRADLDVREDLVASHK